MTEKRSGGLVNAWYRGAWWLYLLLPLSWLFQIVAKLRRRRLTARHSRPHSHSQSQFTFPVPIVVIGNISVGGTGKTPLILALLERLKARGLKVGVVSRGYGADSSRFPILLTEEHSATEVGDEPLLIHRTSGVPVVVDPDRLRACEFLIEREEVDVVLSDDGLQHYGMPRDMEIAVVDGERLFGNGLCLPAGPLREPVSRLSEVQAIVLNCGVNGADAPDSVERFRKSLAMNDAPPVFAMGLQARVLSNLKTGETRLFSGAPFKMGDEIQAVTGIGNPQRFFDLLKALPYSVSDYAFPDHHPFQKEDLLAAGIDFTKPIAMTEKDGIKCQSFANENFWVVQIDVDLSEDFVQEITLEIAKCLEAKNFRKK